MSRCQCYTFGMWSRNIGRKHKIEGSESMTSTAVGGVYVYAFRMEVEGVGKEHRPAWQ